MIREIVMRNERQLPLLAAVLLLCASACGESDKPVDLTIHVAPEEVDLIVDAGLSRGVSLVATTMQNRRIFLRAEAEGTGLEPVETSSLETYAIVMVRSRSTLEPGTYTGTLVVTACLDEECRDKVSGPPLRIPYTVTVLVPLATPNPVTMTGGHTGADETVTVTLPPGTEEYQASVTAGASWLSVEDPTATGFRLHAARLPRGTYEGAVRIAAGNEVRLVQVRYEAPPLPLVVTPGSVYLTAPAGAFASQRVDVLLPDDAMDFGVSVRSGAWLRVSESSSDGVTVEAFPMPAGVHHASLTITAGRETAVVPVTFGVVPDTAGAHGILTSESSITLTAVPGQPFALTYLGVTPATGTSSVAWRVEFPGVSGWLTVTEESFGFRILASTDTLGPGGYAAWLVLSSGPMVPEVRIPIALTIGPALVRPPDREIAVTASTPVGERFGSVPVQVVGSSTRPTAWTATSDSGWLVLDEPSGLAGEVLVYRVDSWELYSLPPGAERIATVTIAQDPSTIPPTSFVVRLSRKVGAMYSIAPYGQPTGRTNRFVVRGVFTAEDLAGGLDVDGRVPVTATLLNQRALELHVPPLAGDGFLHLVNAMGLSDTTLFLDVGTPGPLPAAFWPIPGEKRGLSYDPLRRAVLVANAGQETLHRYALVGTAWTASQRSIDDLQDLGMTLDGATLLATTQECVLFLDPVTLADSQSVLCPGGLFTSPRSAGIPVTNDERAWLVQPGGGTFPLRPFLYEFRVFPQIPPQYALPYETALSLSRDGERLLVSQIDGLYPVPPVISMDASEGALRGAPYDVPFFRRASQSDDGRRVLLDAARVYDRAFALIGNVEAPGTWLTVGGVLSPDGARAYVLAYPADWEGAGAPHPRIIVYDTSGPPASGPLPGLGSFPVSDYPTCRSAAAGCADVQMVVSPDERTLFIAGNAGVAILPIPGTLDLLPSG